MVPSPHQIQNLIEICTIADEVRSILKEPIFITSGLRASTYNAMIGGAVDSAHLYGQALDFCCKKKTGDEIREILKPRLETLKIRMEDLPGSSWVHIDLREPGPSGRFFKPYFGLGEKLILKS